VSLTACRGRRIADVRDTRNVHAAELKELPFEKQWDRCGHLRTLSLPWCSWVAVLSTDRQDTVARCLYVCKSVVLQGK